MRLRHALPPAAAVLIAMACWPWLFGAGDPSPLAPSTSARPGTPEAPVALTANPARTPVPRPDFDARLERLVELGTETSAAIQAENRERAERLDSESRAALAALYRAFPEPETRALQKLSGLAPEDTSLPALVRRKVCILLLGEGLERRWQQRATGSRRRLDSLVSALLASLPLGEKLAEELGAGLLADKPYLGLAHEEAVLDLLQMSNELSFLREVGSALLLTLWDNLAESGARTDGELASLALMYKDDVNPSRRLAALVHLLRNDRYRDLVLDEVCGRMQADLASELGMQAAASLDPPAALEVLERLHAAFDEELLPAFLSLGLRDPELLETAYAHHLADGSKPELRAELVTGAGFSPSGSALARRAYQSDPHPRVRTRALLAITVHGTEASVEETLGSALDDAELCSDPKRLGAMVWALENLSRRGMDDAVQRLGSRLLSRSNLLEGDRERLLEILGR